MDMIGDPKVLFYLKYQNKIDEWASIKSEVPGLVDRFFESVRPELETRLQDAKGQPNLWTANGEDGNPKIGFYLKNWRVGERAPKVLVCFEWRRWKSDFREGYAGIYCPDEGLRKKLRDRLKEGVNEPRWLKGSWKSEPWWAAYRFVSPPEGYWDDLSRFRKQIADEILHWWDDLCEFVDRAIVEHESGDGGAQT